MASRTATAKKTAAKPAAPKKNPTRDEWKTSIKEHKVNDQVLAEELRARGLETRGPTMALASRLERTICGSTPQSKKGEQPPQLVACDVCGGRSWSTDPRCPYCGSQDEVQLDAAAPPAPVVSTPAVAPEAEEPEIIELSDADVLDDEGPMAGFAPGSDAEDEPASERPAAVPAGAIVPVPPAPISEEDAVSAAASIGIQPAEEEVKDLDRSVARIRELALSFVANGWDLGSELNRINDGKLFLARRLGSGAPKYRTFGAFCEGELGNDKSWAYRFMQVAKTFSREQVLANGISKMAFLVHIPEGVREQLLSDNQVMALPIASLREVAKQAKEGVSPQLALANVEAAKAGEAAPPAPVEEPDAEEGADGEGDETGPEFTPGHVLARNGGVAGSDGEAPAPVGVKPAKATAAAGPSNERPTVGDQLGAAPKPQGAVDVITMPGKFQIKLWAFRRKGALVKKQRAHNLADLPRGEYRFQNGAELRICIHTNTANGGLYAVCELTPPTT